MKWSKKALLAKIESTYGTDSVPAASANEVLILGSDVSLTPVAGTSLERETVRAAGEYGSFHEDLVGKHMLLEFTVEMAGAGDVDTATQYGVLLRGCGMAQTINASTSVEYEGVDESQESVSIYLAIDGTRYKLLGCMGNPEWVLAVNQRPGIRFRFMGLFTAAADATFPAMNYSNAVRPVPVTDVNTPTFTLHGTSIKVASCSINLGNVVEYSELVNDTRIVITDRKTVGQVTLEQVLVATKDWYGAVTAHTVGALQIIHGITSTNICQFDAANVQLKNPRLSGSQNRKMLTLDMVMVNVASAVEFKYTTK